jgi:arginine decarboxylase
MQRTITITGGTGTGDTKMAAFDAALFDAGVANYNLIRLSSIIPPGSRIKIEKYDTPADDFGKKLYVVYASEIQVEKGKEAWAGIGWTLSEDDSGKGLFTEHEGHSELEVRNLIQETLTSMVSYRNDSYGPVKEEVVGIRCEEKPVCALVVAVYAAEDWNSPV